jgi:hypothetical protein
MIIRVGSAISSFTPLAADPAVAAADNVGPATIGPKIAAE